MSDHQEYRRVRNAIYRQAGEVADSRSSGAQITAWNAQWPVGSRVEVLTPAGRKLGHTIALAGSFGNLASVRVRLPDGERTFPLRVVRGLPL